MQYDEEGWWEEEDGFRNRGCSVVLHSRIGNIMTNHFPRKAHRFNARDKAMHSRRTGRSFEDVRSHVNYHGHVEVPTRQPCSTNEMDAFLRLSGLDIIYTTVNGENGAKGR